MNDTSKTSVTIKKYANRRLYNTATSSYVTLETLAGMVKQGIEFNVYDAKTSEDITRSVLTQIIVEEEGKTDQQNLLPIGFLRQLIGFYGNNMQWLVPKYLEHSMETLSNNQEQITSYLQTTFGSMFPFGSAFEKMSKQNLAIFERTMRMFAPFVAAPESAPPAPPPDEEPAPCCGSCSVPDETLASPPPQVVAALQPAVVVPLSDCSAPAHLTPVPDPEPVTQCAPSGAVSTADDMQEKIANLQRQLANLAKNRA